MTNQSDRIDILEAAGFTVLGEAADVSGVTPEVATRSVANLAVTPRVRIECGDDSEVGTERSWRDTAGEVGLFADDGSFYVCITGPGAFTLPWVLVRAPEQTGFLELLRERTGVIDFVGISPTGSPVVGVFEEEDENWIVTWTGDR